LSAVLWAMLLVISDTADSLRMPLYFVGGLVRDLLLGNHAVDFDMVVEGDAIELVRQLRQRYGGEIHTHGRFGTGKWLLSPAVWRKVAPDASLRNVPATIDFVTARTEFYAKPSALPEVESSSIKLDLHRRDFTINTLAVRLDGQHLGELLDFYGGRRDLDQGRIRVLHSLSFVDDPTRILRAIRLEQRLGFSIETRTAELMATALPMLDRVTGSRIRNEIEQALREPSPARTLRRMAELEVLTHIHPVLKWTPEMAVYFERVPKFQADPNWRPVFVREPLIFIYFALWMLPLNMDQQEAVMERLRVRKATRQDVTAVSRLMSQAEILPKEALPSVVSAAFRNFSARVLLVGRIAGNGRPVARHIERYYQEWRLVKTDITGDHLRQLGLKPGPRYAVILDRLLAARLDGEVSDEASERALLAQIIDELETESTTQSQAKRSSS
jgi:tRNA nucleotidyltransferase (CCA-adding enzyme)